jgi:predicted NBD/HSP70 family sugar kinase
MDLGTATRRQIVERSGMSFPTATLALQELIDRDLVTQSGKLQGPRGRATLAYRLAGRAGWVLGLGVDATDVRARAVALDGTELSTAEIAFERDTPPAQTARFAADLASRLRSDLRSRGEVRAVALAVNTYVPRSFDTPGVNAPNALALCSGFAQHAGLPPSTSLLIENDVNAAAMAEHANGQMVGHNYAVYLQFGLGVGAGLFVEGQLVRGAFGTAGEIGSFPDHWIGPGGAVPTPGELERAVGSRGLLERARPAWTHGEEELCVANVMARAEEPALAEVLAVQAQGVSRVIHAVMCLLDPSVVVLGGELAQFAAFTRPVLGNFRALSSLARLVVSTKGLIAPAEGAALVALDHARAQMLGPTHHRTVPDPTTWT